MDHSIFNGKKFYIIFSNDFSIKSLLIDYGALFQSYLSESVSFAISDSITASEVGEAEEIYKVAVVTSEWVRVCLQWNKCQYIKSFHPSVRLLFNQITFYIANMCKDDRDILKGYIRVFGGYVVDSLSEDVTHVVIGTIEGDAHEEVVCQCSSKMTIVTPNWVTDSINQRSIQLTTLFNPEVIYERLKTLQISSENERVNQTKKTVMAPPPPTEVSKRPSTESVINICTSAQFTLSGLQQAVPISIQDSLLTRQLPNNISRIEPPSYQLPPRTMQTQGLKMPTVTTSASQSASNIMTVPTSTTTKSKSSKNNNKHLQEQGLNEMEKEAIVMQNVISILGKRTTNATNVIEKNSASNTTARKPRSPRPKGNKNQITTTAVVGNIPQKTTFQSSQVVPSSVVGPLASNVVITETKNEPKSPQHYTQPSVSTSPRFGMVCGLPPARPQTLLNRSLEAQLDNTDIDQSSNVSQLLSKTSAAISSSSSNTVQMCSTPSQAPFQNLFLHHQQQQQQILDQSGHVSQLHTRQLQRQFQQQQQQQHQHRLITLGQIQTPQGQQQQQQWQHNSLHMSPNQHSSPSAASSLLSSPAQTPGLCATVPQSPSVHQMYQLQHQLNPQQTNYYRWISQIPRTGIINNGNPMMLNNMGGTVPLNTSMVPNVATPLHLQSSVSNGNPATIMLHQQQLHVASNLPQSAMHSPNGGQAAVPLNMTPGKILSGAVPRAVLQHSPQLSGVGRGPNNSYSILQSNHHGIMQNGGNPDHNSGHHPTSGSHINRPLANILRLPQYVGHEGATTSICRENCLIGCVFFLYGYEEVSQAKKDGWLSSIRSHGGETVASYNQQTVTHLIVDCQLNDPNLFKMALKHKTRVVTIYWVNDVIDKGLLEPPFEIIHLPSPFSKNLSFSYIRRQIVSITGFEGEERKKIEYMVINLGVKYTEYLEASNTVLICKKISGRKYEAAQKMGIACVNVRWLQDLYFGDLSTLSAEIEHKYQSFESADVSIRLERMTHRVQELMVGWIVPVRLDESTWKKYRILKEQFEVEKNTRKRQAEAFSLQSSVNAKKLKWQLPSLSAEETELADSCALNQLRPSVSFQDNGNDAVKIENNDTIDDLLQQNENQQRIFVAFTGLLPEQRDKLADLVASLGGQVTEDMMQCTHLVTKNIIRTPKFYYGILRGCHIVTMKWVQACAYRQQFIDETPWKLEDKESERQFGFSLDMSLQRARNRVNNYMLPLFHSLEFFLSPRAKHRQICMDLIRACGGIIREKRPIQKMALMTEPRHLIICHEDDSHLANYLTRTKTGNKAVHHEEFVLSCVMRQELDFDSYQIQYVSVIKNAFNNQSLTTNNILETGTTLGRDSPSRSAVSDSTVDTADTHISQPAESVHQTACSISSLERPRHESMVMKVEETVQELRTCSTDSTIMPISATFVDQLSSARDMVHVKLESVVPNELTIASYVQEDLGI